MGKKNPKEPKKNGALKKNRAKNPEEGTKNFKELDDTPEDKVKTKKTAEKNGK